MRVRDGDRLLHNFSSNDYLGFAGPDSLSGRDSGTLASGPPGPSSSQGADDRPPLGSGASALVTGYRPEHRDLEHALADWLGREAVLLTSSGFMANLAVLTALAGRGDTIVQDRLCHASLIDAARLSGATLKRYAHGEVAAATHRLATAAGHVLLVTDGIFSMDGDAAPLGPLAAAATEHAATLVVDDAHGIGVLGPEGGGLCAAEGLGASAVPVLIGTFGKAFGTAGAFIAGSRSLIEHLENQARSVIYSTALPPVIARASLRALARIRSGAGDELRARLQAHIERFRAGAVSRGIPLLPSVSPIQPLVVGEAAHALALSRALEADGYLVTAIRPPTVPRGTSRLRITLSAAHSDEQVDGLIDALARAMDAAGRDHRWANGLDPA